MEYGILGNKFDLNNDGELDWSEKTAEAAFLSEVLREEEPEDDCMSEDSEDFMDVE